MTTDAPWTAELTVRVRDAALASALELALRPESAREVPRARVGLTRTDPTTLDLQLLANDVGAMRAALNTYLGWVHLAIATAGAGAALARTPEP
jgi:tRNA threonylcarbamoyladenosine modification (KEOPS) complex  Pcc1 subunit